MVTSVQLGNFFSANGRTVLGGVGGSGLDTEALIKSLTDAKAQSATKLQDRITLDGKKSDALTQFQSLLSAFQRAADALRNPPGVGNDSENAFRFTNASVTSNTSIAGSTYMSVGVAPGASLQTYNISEIHSLAAVRIQTSEAINIANQDASAVSAAPAGGQFKAGTFTLKGQQIKLDANDSLVTVAAKFNSVKDQTGISANIIKVSDGVFKLSFVATASGTAHDFDLNDVVTPMNLDGILDDPDGVFVNIDATPGASQDASDARFTVNGITITRSTNTINDAISGVTFTLLQTTPALTTLSVSVNPDTTTAQNSIIGFGNAYNDIRTFFAKQTQLKDDGTFADTALLADNQTFRGIVANITAQVSSIVNGISGSNPSRMADVGITLVNVPASTDTPTVTNAINVDDGKLSSALASNINGVADLFGFNFASNNPALKIFSRTNALSVNQFSLTINPKATQTLAIDAADADMDPVVFTAPAAGQIKAGVITIGGVDITLDDGDTLQDVVDKFNTAGDAGSGMTAALSEVTPGHFQIVFTSTPSGSGNNFNLSSSSVDTNNLFDGFTFESTSSFQATYNPGGGPVTVNVNATAINGGGYTIRGITGTALEGLVMVYGSTLSSVTDVTVTQGIADKLYNLSDSSLAKDTGPLALELAAIKTSDSKLQDQIDKINQQVSDYRDQLLAKFGALEQAISRVNSLLTSLDAQEQARKNASG